MRFVNLLGVLQRARRFLSTSGGVQDSDVKNPAKLAELLRGLQKRVADIEAVTPPEPIEFEVTVGASGSITRLAHNFNGAVRWYVVNWLQSDGVSFPTMGPILVRDASSDSKNLCLRSYASGRAIIRVESTFVDVDQGITLGAATAVHGALSPSVSGMRLTLATATPVPSSDVTGASATTVYLTQYLSGQIRLYYNSEWVTRSATEVSLALGTLTAGGIYDVFAYWTGSEVALELSAAWASATARTDALAYQDGTLVKSSDHKRLYVGTIRMQTTTQCEDSRNRRFCWNMYNRVRREMWIQDTTGSWTYTNPNGAWRDVRGNSTNMVEFVCGEATQLTMRASIGCSTTAASGFATGIGISSNTAQSAQMVGNWVNASGHVAKAQADYVGTLAAAYYTIWWLESGQSNSLVYTFQGSGNVWKSGMSGEILG